MFKKLKILILATLILMALAACSDDTNEEGQEQDTNDNTEETQGTEETGEQQEEAAANQVAEDKIVATVNGKELKGADYNMMYQQVQMTFMQQGQDPSSEEAANQIKQATLDQLIGQELLIQEAKNEGYSVSEEEVNEAIETQYKAQYDSDEAFQDALEKNGLTVEELKADLTEQMAANQFITEEVDVPEPTDEEIQQYFDQIKEMSEQEVKLEDVRETIVQQLQQQKQGQEVSKLVEQLKEENEYEILL